MGLPQLKSTIAVTNIEHEHENPPPFDSILDHEILVPDYDFVALLLCR